MRLALVTDAWLPRTNGVVRRLTVTATLLQRSGHAVEVLDPDSVHIATEGPLGLAARRWAEAAAGA